MGEISLKSFGESPYFFRAILRPGGRGPEAAVDEGEMAMLRSWRPLRLCARGAKLAMEAEDAELGPRPPRLARVLRRWFGLRLRRRR